MIGSLEMRQFRGHRSLRIDGLKRINVITGRNNAGKTAVLEALLLLGLPSNPVGAIQAMNKVRRYEGWNKWPDSWTTLFNQGSDEPLCVASDSETPHFRRSLTARRSLQPAPPGMGQADDSHVTAIDLIRPRPHLELDYELPGGKVTVGVSSEAGISQTIVEGADVLRESANLNLAYSPAHDFHDPYDLARKFTSFVLDGTEDGVIETLRLIDPRIQRMLVLAMSEGAALFTRMEGMDRLLPASLMGDGMVRLLGIILNMPDARNGLFLLDEAENGIHHSAMKSVWRVIAQTAEKLDIQVFATTHSYESIGAVQAAMRDLGQLDDLRLWRLEQSGDHTRAVDYTGEDISTAIDAGYEIR